MLVTAFQIVVEDDLPTDLGEAHNVRDDINVVAPEPDLGKSEAGLIPSLFNP